MGVEELKRRQARRGRSPVQDQTRIRDPCATDRFKPKPKLEARANPLEVVAATAGKSPAMAVHGEDNHPLSPLVSRLERILVLYSTWFPPSRTDQ